MAGVLQHLRSSTLNKRPNPASMVDGQVAINYASGSPGMFFKDSNGSLVKVGPVHVGTTAPNVSPASGGTAGNSRGEQWLDTTGGTYVFKIWDGSAWRSESGTFVDTSGDTMTGALGVIAGTASAPGVFFSGDPNTGIYSPGADQLAISTGGSVRLLVDASGNITTRDGTLILGAVGGEGGQLELANPTNTGTVYSLDSDSATNARLFTINNNTSLQIGQLSGIGGVIKFHISGSESVRIDDNGRLLVGASTASNFFGTDFKASIQSIETGGQFALGLERPTNDSSPVSLQFRKTRSTTPGGVGIVSNNDQLGTLRFHGTDGVGAIQAAAIFAAVDGTPGVNDMPGRLVFSTTADGASSPTERLLITSAGLVGIGTSAPIQKLTVIGASNDTIDETTGVLKLQDDGGNGLLFGTRTSSPYQSYIQSAFVQDTSVAQYSLLLNPIGGNVGIGTTSPSVPLAVQADSSAFAADMIGRAADNTSIIRFKTTDNATALGSIGQYGTTMNIATVGAGPIAFYTNNTERGRWDSSGRLLVGTSSSVTTPVGQPPLQVVTGQSIIRYSSNGAFPAAVDIGKSKTDTTGSNVILGSGDEIGWLNFVGADGSSYISSARIAAQVDGTPGANDMPGRLVLSTTADGASSPTERMRITSSGAILVAKTADDINTQGIRLSQFGVGSFCRDAEIPLFVNRNTDDGGLVIFRQDGVDEGNISVSGTTVSYNGAHLSRWSQLPSGAERTEILRGSILSNIDEMCEWTDEDNEQLNRMKVSDVEGDKNVSGVFQAWDDDDDTYTDDFYCAMTGDFIIRIAGDVTVERGDLLMSAGDGTAKPQDDDIIRSKTIAKVTSTNVSCTYEDGSYCVPCVLMAC